MQRQKRRARIYVIAVIVSVAAASILSSSAWASPTWTTATTNVSVTEGNPATVTFTLTNDTPVAIVPDQIIIFFVSDSGDLSDLANRGVSILTNNLTSCFALAFVSSTCTQPLSFATAADSGETDANSGSTTQVVELVSSPLSAPQDRFTASSNPFTITVNDPTLTPAPEPSSLWLFGIGLAGVSMLVRRMRTRAV